MKKCIVHLESNSPYSQSRPHETEKLEKETSVDFDARTWREHLNLNNSGHVVIPSMAIKQAIDRVAKMIGMQIPGRGKNTYTKHFLSGILVEQNIVLYDKKSPIKGDDVLPVRIFCNADGVRGSGKRVWRTFPMIPVWSGFASIIVIDEQITKDVFEHHICEAGKYVGIGRFRPQNGGTNGRFNVTSVEWE